MKAEIKYKITDANGLSEITMITEMDNALNVNEAILILKKHYKERLDEGKIKIKQQVDAWEKQNNHTIGWEEREQLVRDFYFYDEKTIQIISINDLSYGQLELIQYEVIHERLKTKLEFISKAIKN